MRHLVARSAAPPVLVRRDIIAAPTPQSAYAVPLPQSPFAVPSRRTSWPAQPFAAPGRVIELGAYITPGQLDAARWRLLRAYPYLGTLARSVTFIGPTPGRPRYYRLRLAASSSREARALCNNLHRIGRGCMIV